MKLKRKVKKNESLEDIQVPVICEPGSSVNNRTGDWRVFKPVFNKEKCIQCRLCMVFCPDSAIVLEKGYPKWNYEVCKGCLICMQVCPVNAIGKMRDQHED